MPNTVKQTNLPHPIERRIHIIRGQKVMLDNDLAKLYQVQTFNLNKAVKRNLARFPDDFMFRLTKEEAVQLTFQSGISSWGGRRTLPYAFTEHGVAMLSAILKSQRAIDTSIRIIRTFVRLREMIAANKDLAERVRKLETSQHGIASVIDVLVKEIADMKALPPPSKRKIGFDL
jgi:hypothetical protein